MTTLAAYRKLLNARKYLEMAYNNVRRVKNREVFEDIKIISPIEVTIDRIEGSMKILQIALDRLDGGREWDVLFERLKIQEVRKSKKRKTKKQ